jgi:hypothetical protein
MNNENNILSKKSVVFQVAIVLSAMMLATSLAIPSLVQTKAFAQDPIETEVNTDANVDTDVDVIDSDADCREASDQTDQGISQSIDEQTTSDDENIPQVLTGVNTAFNVVVTPDIDLTGQCNTADQTSQEIEQSQNLQPDSEASDAYVISVNEGRNYAFDPNYSIGGLPEQ